MPEVFIYSSNIGSAREADVVGVEGHREFLKRLGLLDRMTTELPEVARPTEPKVWKKVHSITAAFGHGFSTTPMQTAVGAAALMNGGYLMSPTFLPRTAEEAIADATKVVENKTSADMRYLYLLNATAPGGSGKRATVPGYRVGGKTGTAEKVVNGRYSSTIRFNAFVACVSDGRSTIYRAVDRRRTEAGEARHGRQPRAMNAAPIVANIIRRSASLLGVKPEFSQENEATLVSYQ